MPLRTVASPGGVAHAPALVREKAAWPVNGPPSCVRVENDSMRLWVPVLSSGAPPSRWPGAMEICDPHRQDDAVAYRGGMHRPLQPAESAGGHTADTRRTPTVTHRRRTPRRGTTQRRKPRDAPRGSEFAKARGRIADSRAWPGREGVCAITGIERRPPGR